MTRIALVCARAVAGGAERTAAALPAELARQGMATVAILGDNGPLAGWLGRTCEVVVLDGASPDGRADAIRPLLERHRVDAVVGLCAAGHLLGGPAADEAGIPALWWRMLTPRRRPTEIAAARVPVGVVVCPNRFSVAGQRELTPGVPIVRVPLGVPVAALAARGGEGGAVRRHLGWDAGPIIGIVARLDPSKGQDVFLRAAAGIARRWPTARFLIVGGAILGTEGDLPDRLRRLAAELGLGERVRFIDHVEDPVPWVAALDVSVAPSLHEAFGRAVVEALALGVPVVASRTDGPTEILDRGRWGRLVPPGDAAALESAVAGLIEAPGVRAELAARGRERAARFSEERMGDALARILRRLVRAGTTRSGAGDSGGECAARRATR